ncbi:MAG TPA: ABC transporter permease [Acidimicrobiia bacterium]|jgi:ABC-type dipeptide/oligopeptide/nickel transport system permease subunit
MIGSPQKKVAGIEALAEEGRFLEKPSSLWKTAWKRLLRRKTGVTGMIIIGLLLLLALFAPLLATHDPTHSLIGEEEGAVRRAPPCIHALGCPEDQPQHILGLDGNVRDFFSRIVYGSRLSLTIGLTTVSAAILIGALLGAIAGFWSGWADNTIMRVMDVLLGFPALLLAIAIVSVLGPGLSNALIAIAIVSIPAYARVMRASVLQVKQLDYVAASRALGASKARILIGRVLPNAITPLVVLATLGIASAILEAAGLSFLGLGAQPPTPEWGQMLGEERNQVFSSPFLVFFPGLMIMLTVLGFNLLGDGLRDALDPRLND